MPASSRRYAALLFSCSIAILMLLTGFPTSAQDWNISDLSPQLETPLRFYHLTSDDGLAQNTIHAILQDSTGFMWFGTESGLSRYDGYNFVTFEADANDPTGLVRDHILALYEDNSGMIWIATEGGGVSRLNPNTLEITSYLLGPEDAPYALPGDRPVSLYQDSQGYLWVGSNAEFGLARMNLATGEVEVLHPDEDLDSSPSGTLFQDILEMDDHSVWIAAGLTVKRFDLVTSEFTSFPLQSDAGARSLYQDQQGRIWVGGNNGLHRFDESLGGFERILDTGVVSDILEPAPGGTLWLATNDGILQVDTSSGELVNQALHSTFALDSLNNIQINRLYQDESGLIWIGGDSGLDVYDPMFNRFELYRHLVLEAPYGLAPGVVSSISITDSNTAWIGVDNVLHQFDFSDQTIRLYSLAESGFPDFEITSVYQDHSGIVWIGGNQRYILQLDPETSQLSELELVADEERDVVTNGLTVTVQAPEPSGPPLQSERPDGDGKLANQDDDPSNNGPGNRDTPEGRPHPPRSANGEIPSVVRIIEDTLGNIWLVRDITGIYRVNPDRTDIVRFRPPEADAILGTSNSIRPPLTNAYLDANGDLWLTSQNGLSRLDVATETYQRYLLLSSGSDAPTQAIAEGADGVMWIASQQGLIRLNPATGDTQLFTTNDGLSNNYLLGIERAADGSLWISSKRGLSHFDPDTTMFRNYDKFDGLQATEFNSGIAAQGPDGRMYFGGNGGLTAFYPDQIRVSDYQPSVILDEFELFSQQVEPGPDSILSQPIWLTDALTLNYDQNYLAFEFAALNYGFGDVNQYRYRLEGFETHWTETDSTRRFASYTNLAPGNYVFRVQGANRDGIWSSNEATISLTVTPPWWATTQFRLLIAVIIVGSLALIYAWRVQRLRAHSRNLEKQVQEKTKELISRTRDLELSEGQLRKAKDVAESASRAKSAFLANMSHELRSPLNAILGFAQVTKRNHVLAPEVSNNLDIVLHSGEHLLTLINQVLDLSKIEAGQMILIEQDFDLYQLLDDLEDMFRLAAAEKDLAWQIMRDDSLPRYICADITKLRQILINLIGNAIKFTQHGSVHVIAKCVGQSKKDTSARRLQFVVSDTGPGIAEDEMDTLFDAFLQTPTGINTGEGTGLGLSISRRYTQLMGGNIHVTSQLNHGATFTVELACNIVTKPMGEKTKLDRHIVGLAPGQPNYRILVVDDKWVNRQIIIRLLEPLGFELREAENGQQALDVAQNFKPHLVWMDIRMPVMDGLEATERLKATTWGKSTKVIAVTASIYDQDGAERVSEQCDDFLRKPIQPKQIYNVLGQQLGVQFMFADEKEGDTQQDVLSQDDIQQALELLPTELIDLLREGVELGDFAIINDAITRIGQIHRSLANTLDSFAQRFQFDEMLSCLKKEQVK